MRKGAVSWQAVAALWIVIGRMAPGEESPQQARTARLLELVPPELRFEERPVAVNENAYPLLLDAVSAFVDLPDDLIRRTREAFAKISNPVGKYIAASWPEYWIALEDDHALRSALQLEADLEATRAILALRLHIELYCEPAPTLETLVERKLLREVPRDPFSGKPLGYSLERGRLWSVGPDGEGDGTGLLFGDGCGSLEANVWPVPKY